MMFALVKNFKDLPWPKNFMDQPLVYEILKSLKADTKASFERKAADPKKLAAEEFKKEQEEKEETEKKRMKFEQERKHQVKEAAEALRKSMGNGKVSLFPLC